MSITGRLYFNSRPSARGDSVEREGRKSQRNFNSRPSARGVVFGLYILSSQLFISIHAPPRGATLQAMNETFHRCYFNSRPSARGDRPRTPESGKRVRFQFTPLREGRHYLLPPYLFTSVFQFTPLREGRPGKTQVYGYNNLFQFTPLREGRHCFFGTGKNRHEFQFTPLREGRPGSVAHMPYNEFISIHAPPRGATKQERMRHMSEIFQFTPLREGRRVDPLDCPCHRVFQFTPLREGRPEDFGIRVDDH